MYKILHSLHSRTDAESLVLPFRGATARLRVVCTDDGPDVFLRFLFVVEEEGVVELELDRPRRSRMRVLDAAIMLEPKDGASGTFSLVSSSTSCVCSFSLVSLVISSSAVAATCWSGRIVKRRFCLGFCSKDCQSGEAGGEPGSSVVKAVSSKEYDDLADGDSWTEDALDRNEPTDEVGDGHDDSEDIDDIDAAGEHGSGKDGGGGGGGALRAAG